MLPYAPTQSRIELSPIYVLALITVLNHISYLGSRILLALYAIELGASPFTIGILIALYSLLPLMLSVYAGQLSDRIGHRLPMLAGSALAVFGMLLPWAMPGQASLYASAALIGGGFCFFNIAVQALVGLISAPDTRAYNFSMLTMGYAISSLIGPLVVGYSVEYMGHPNTYLVLAAVTLVPIALLCIKRLIPIAPILPDLRGERSFMDLVRIPRLRAMFIASGVCVTGWDLFTFYMPIYGRSISLSAATIGEIIAMFGVASFVARFAMPAATRRFREEQLLAASLFLAAATFAIFPLVHNVNGLMLLAFIMGLGLGCGQPLTMMLTYARSPQGRAGEANGLRQMANNVTHIFVPLFFGAIGSAFGLTPVFWTNTVLLVIGGHFSRK